MKRIFDYVPKLNTYLFFTTKWQINSSCMKYEVEVIFGKYGSMMEKFVEMKCLFETRNIKTKTLQNRFKLYY
jgi:hypothetical protein